jgi:hypothetical protein
MLITSPLQPWHSNQVNIRNSIFIGLFFKSDHGNQHVNVPCIPRRHLSVIGICQVLRFFSFRLESSTEPENMLTDNWDVCVADISPRTLDRPMRPMIWKPWEGRRMKIFWIWAIYIYKKKVGIQKLILITTTAAREGNPWDQISRTNKRYI